MIICTGIRIMIQAGFDLVKLSFQQYTIDWIKIVSNLIGHTFWDLIFNLMNKAMMENNSFKVIELTNISNCDKSWMVKSTTGKSTIVYIKITLNKGLTQTKPNQLLLSQFLTIEDRGQQSTIKAG